MNSAALRFLASRAGIGLAGALAVGLTWGIQDLRLSRAKLGAANCTAHVAQIGPQLEQVAGQVRMQNVRLQELQADLTRRKNRAEAGALRKLNRPAPPAGHGPKEMNQWIRDLLP